MAEYLSRDEIEKYLLSRKDIFKPGEHQPLEIVLDEGRHEMFFFNSGKNLDVDGNILNTSLQGCTWQFPMQLLNNLTKSGRLEAKAPLEIGHNTEIYTPKIQDKEIIDEFVDVVKRYYRVANSEGYKEAIEQYRAFIGGVKKVKIEELVGILLKDF